MVEVVNIVEVLTTTICTWIVAVKSTYYSHAHWLSFVKTTLTYTLVTIWSELLLVLQGKKMKDNKFSSYLGHEMK